MSLAVVIPLQSSINDVIENQKENKTKKTGNDNKMGNKEKFKCFSKMMKTNVPVLVSNTNTKPPMVDRTFLDSKTDKSPTHATVSSSQNAIKQREWC